MRVISQNRDMSVDFEKVIISVGDYGEIFFSTYENNSPKIMLGKFGTSKRAKEVFEDMHRAYNPVGIITCALTEEQAKQFIGSANVKQNIIMMPAENKDWVVNTYDNIVYYMPEE
ncbi:MAG TPA: hypothetical protein H9742_14085 [Candidatus Acetatifactor stercoripullorum]|uniref:Uncharacterized protein n=1 Tax=Candidatus Acetatifactor stercoripullorum TaxID=2838414 RepID=A0A9D1R9N5_9FIRM|nr:hypothetical protein [Candidatus Acetatifactor stercoripullorum]